MRGISETISTVIISSVIIMVSIMIFYIATYSLTTTMQASEYGYMKSSMINIAVSIPEIIKGSSISVTVPKGSIGVGWRVLKNIIYQIKANTTNGEILEYNITNPTALEIRSYAVSVTGSRLVYGVNNTIVGDVAYISSIWEYYSSGASILNFNTSRFYINIYNVTNGNRNETYIRIYYLNLTPTYISGPKIIQFTLGGRIYEKQVESVQSINITLVNKATGESETIFTYKSQQPITLLLIIDRLDVVIT